MLFHYLDVVIDNPATQFLLLVYVPLLSWCNHQFKRLNIVFFFLVLPSKEELTLCWPLLQKIFLPNIYFREYSSPNTTADISNSFVEYFFSPRHLGTLRQTKSVYTLPYIINSYIFMNIEIAKLNNVCILFFLTSNCALTFRRPYVIVIFTL